jgi:hypothetical protein
VIVVAGDLAASGETSGAVPAAAIAGAAVAFGDRVEIVGVLSGDAAGDRRLIELAARGIGHAAVLRTGAARLEAADLELALRYLPEVGAIVLVEPGPELIAPAIAAASWSGAGLVIVSGRDVREPEVPEGVIVLAGPDRDPDDAFAGVVAKLASRIAAGGEATHAWRDTVAELGLSGGEQPG